MYFKRNSPKSQIQFSAGGGENDEQPVEAAMREVFEETGINNADFKELSSICYIPTNVFSEIQRNEWGNNIFVIPEYSFIYNMSHKTILTMIYTAFRRWKFSSNKDAIAQEYIKFNHRFKTLSGKIAACYPVEADNRVYNQFAVFTVHNSSKKW